MSDPFEPPSIRQQLSEPVKSLARIVDFFISTLRPGLPPLISDQVTLVCISDTHTGIPPDPIPDGDILIHAGDLTNKGTPSEIQAQIDWLDSLPHKHKIAIAGNHDTYLDPRSRETLEQSDRDGSLDWKSIKYLQDNSTTVHVRTAGKAGRALKIYGSPHIPACGGAEFAFQYPRTGGDAVWTGNLPVDIDVLVTHTPPRFHLDLTGGAALGDACLLREVRRVRPRVHVFGHVHAGKSDVWGRARGGREVVRWDEGLERWFERLMERSSIAGTTKGFLDWESWRCLSMMVSTGIGAVVRERWFAAKTPATLMVNASVMYRNTGRLLNPPQVVVI